MIETTVRGDAAACAAVAVALREQSAALGAAAEEADAGSGVAATTFSGLAAMAFRHRSGEVAASVSAVSTSVGVLGDGLADLADGLYEVEEVMASARAFANRRLAVRGTTILTPGPYATAEQHDDYRVVAALVGRARQREQLLQDRWRSHLLGYRDGVTTPPLLDPAAPPAGPGPVTPGASWPPRPEEWPEGPGRRADRELPPQAPAPPERPEPTPRPEREPSDQVVVRVLDAAEEPDDLPAAMSAGVLGGGAVGGAAAAALFLPAAAVAVGRARRFSDADR